MARHSVSGAHRQTNENFVPRKEDAGTSPFCDAKLIEALSAAAAYIDEPSDRSPRAVIGAHFCPAAVAASGEMLPMRSTEGGPINLIGPPGRVVKHPPLDPATICFVSPVKDQGSKKSIELLRGEEKTVFEFERRTNGSFRFADNQGGLRGCPI
jgi:hypothetical protein